MIGERLEEARKSKGISIREAAEATKIRGEYLVSMEDNSFDINLPEIYIRGFLKNYAKFLSVDPDQIIADYDVLELSRAPKPVPPPVDPSANPNAKPTRSSFGRMEISPTDASAKPKEGTPAEASKKQTPPPPTLESKGTSRNHENWADNKALYLKIGIVFAGVLALVVILVVLIQLITRGNDTELNPEIVRPVDTTLSQPAPTPSVNNVNSITIAASDSVTIIVEQTIDRKRLYSGTLNAGESISIEKNGPVSVRFTNGAALVVEKNGKEFRPSENGVGRTVIE